MRTGICWPAPRSKVKKSGSPCKAETETINIVSVHPLAQLVGLVVALNRPRLSYSGGSTAHHLPSERPLLVTTLTACMIVTER